MSVDKLVDSTQLDSDLTSVANAIRTKGGTSAQLAFPAGFVQAIGDIPSGGSVQIATGTFTGNGTSNEQIVSCDFEPDIVYAKRDKQPAVDYNSCYAMGIVRDLFAMGFRLNANVTNETQGGTTSTATGMVASANVFSSYDSNAKQVTLHYSMNSCKWAATTYDYVFIKYT